MTDEQIRERCLAVLSSLHVTDSSEDLLMLEEAERDMRVMQTLCQEMIAEGLERAAIHGDKLVQARTGAYHLLSDTMREMGKIRNEGDESYVVWCRQEAARVKDGGA